MVVAKLRWERRRRGSSAHWASPKVWATLNLETFLSASWAAVVVLALLSAPFSVRSQVACHPKVFETV